MYLQSKITNEKKGLIRGRDYQVLSWTLFEKDFFVHLLNDFGEEIEIEDPTDYFEKSDLEDIRL